MNVNLFMYMVHVLVTCFLINTYTNSPVTVIVCVSVCAFWRHLDKIGLSARCRYADVIATVGMVTSSSESCRLFIGPSSSHNNSCYRPDRQNSIGPVTTAVHDPMMAGFLLLDCEGNRQHKLQALVFHILPSTTAVFSYVIGS